jgi:pSer/pThr/pTyr-binding forkhead associated (FHA) protein
MSFLEFGGQRHALPLGESVIGSDASAVVTLEGDDVLAQHAVIEAHPDGQVAIRRAHESADVLVNGVRLGPNPTPLLHGDKVGVGKHELSFIDERKSGSTQYIQAIDPATLAGMVKPSGKKRKPTTGTGGRLVSLTDGREYQITGMNFLIGRDASCDVVVTSKSISRRHADIMTTPKGYVLVDSSTNGTIVNGKKVEGQHLLARGDIIQCGEHEFRFYADLAREEPVAAPPAAAPPAAPMAAPVVQASSEPVAPVVRAKSEPAAPIVKALPEPVAPVVPVQSEFAAPMVPARPEPAAPVAQVAPRPPDKTLPAQRPAPGVRSAAPAPGAEHRLSNTLHGVRGVKPTPLGPKPAPAPSPGDGMGRRASGRPRHSEGSALANIVVRSGPLKGQRYPLRTPVVNIGRADYNDVVIVEGSVSTNHAKIQRREGIWVLVDLDSTNGTMVDGERVVDGEVPLAPGALLRFGDVQCVFEPTDDTVDAPKGSSTQVLSSIRRDDLPGPGGGR